MKGLSRRQARKAISKSYLPPFWITASCRTHHSLALIMSKSATFCFQYWAVLSPLVLLRSLFFALSSLSVSEVSKDMMRPACQLRPNAVISHLRLGKQNGVLGQHLLHRLRLPGVDAVICSQVAPEEPQLHRSMLPWGTVPCRPP